MENQIDIFSRQGNYATIEDVTTSNTRNGATLYHFKLLIDGLSQVITATAFINPKLGNKMMALAKVYAKFKPGDRVKANLYASGNFIDVYRLQYVPKPKERKMSINPSQLPEEDHDLIYQSKKKVMNISFD